jgi:RNA polymerase sigma factor (TIGR02999 family)
MRRILINRARDKGRLKRGGGWQRLNLDQVELAFDTPAEELLALDEAMQLLAEEEPAGAKLIQLKFYAGLNLRQAAKTLGLPQRTAERHWAYARAWLYERLDGDAQSESDAAQKM